MKLNEILSGQLNAAEWEAKGYELPKFDIAKLREKTAKEPTWVHFGGGNIFRAFPAAILNDALNTGKYDRGVIVAETFDFEVIDKAYAPYNNLSLLVSLQSTGTIEKKVIASVTEALKADPQFSDWQRLIEIFKNPSLQMISFTITEKGYTFNEADLARGMSPLFAMGKVCALLFERFKAGELTPLAVPCELPASAFKAVYAIGALDAENQKAVLVPVDHISANVPCYVVTDKDVDEIKVDEKVYIAAGQPDQIPVMWDGGLFYRVPGTFSWKMLSYDEKEYDASQFTQFEYVNPKQMAFAANIENYRARTFLENTKYPEPETPSVIGNYFKPAPPRLDIPHNIGVPVPAEKVKDAVVKYGLQSDLSDAQSRMVLDGSDMAYMPNLIPCNTYYFQVEAGGEVLTKGSFWVDGPVRMIYAPSINNIRDIGGWSVQDGKQVRYGLIYRGGEANGLHPSVAEDRQTLVDLGVGAEIDLRKDNNYDSYDCKLEHLTNAQSKARYKQWFPFILNHIKEGKAVYYHCVWGADRTGLVSVLLEGVLGLTQEQMNLEYELTSLSFAGLRPKSGYADGDHQKLIEKIKTYEGETLRDKFDTYWTKEVGISQDLIDEFRSIMLVDAPATAIKGICLTEKTVPSGIKAVYSVSGTKLPASVLNSKKGTYVVEYNNGTTQKVTVK